MQRSYVIKISCQTIVTLMPCIPYNDVTMITRKMNTPNMARLLHIIIFYLQRRVISTFAVVLCNEMKDFHAQKMKYELQVNGVNGVIVRNN